MPVSVGYQSGSHYSTVQALEQYLKPEQMNLVYSDGMLFARMEKLFDGKAPAVHLFGGLITSPSSSASGRSSTPPS